jgi:hypothetical protein
VSGQVAPQPQQPPPQQPPESGAERDALPRSLSLPRLPTSAPAIDSIRTVSSWPFGHVAGSPEAIISRCSVNVWPHERHRNS